MSSSNGSHNNFTQTKSAIKKAAQKEKRANKAIVSESVVPVVVNSEPVDSEPVDSEPVDSEPVACVEIDEKSVEKLTEPIVNIWAVRKNAAQAKAELELALEKEKELERMSKVKVVFDVQAKETVDVQAKETVDVQAKETVDGQAKETGDVRAKKSAGGSQAKIADSSGNWTEVSRKGFKQTGSKTSSDARVVQQVPGPKKVSQEQAAKNEAYQKKREESYQKMREAKNCLYQKAFGVAQDIVLKDCLKPFATKDVCEDINMQFQHVINYRRTFVIECKEEDDDIVIDADDSKYQFSKARFVENRYFQNKLRDEINILIPNAWVSIFPGRVPNTLCIGLKQRI
jgi:hypothetical protein